MTIPQIAYKRLLNDIEIESAIRRGLIELENPEVYLSERRLDLIQPASMDLLLRGAEVCDILTPNRKREHSSFPVDHHPDVDDSFITLWPNTQTELSVEHFKGFAGELLWPQPELRSTPRRIGLDTGFNPLGFGLGDEEYAFLNVRNPQGYPVSIERGFKIAQALFYDRRLVLRQDGYGFAPSPIKLGSGIPLTSTRMLENLVKSKDLRVSPNITIENGLLLFHAGKTATYNGQEHIVLRKNGNHSGINLRRETSRRHIIKPGKFIDIETRECIALSQKVGINVYYLFNIEKDEEFFTFNDSLNLWLTENSTGGWIDPGYGYNTENGAVFSAQRKAFTKQITIREGDPIAVGLVWYFPAGVGKAYGKERGSHYNNAKSFEAPK